jgi:hypothetical protein
MSELIVGKKYELRGGRVFRLFAIDLFGMAHVKFPEDRDELQIRKELLAEEAVEVGE